MATADPRPTPPAPRREALTPGRVEAFSDGIFAIAATLLILNVQLPQASAGGLAQELLKLWPSYIAYAASFVTIGVMWMNHHALFARVSRIDRPLLMLNLFMLGVIAFLPFPTQVLGTHIGVSADATPAALLYAVTGILIAFGYGGVYLWIGTHQELLHDRFAGINYLANAPRFLVGTVAYGACIPLAFFYPPAVVVVIIAVILYYAVDQLPQPRAVP
jgi:uncharacterized membrane protein